MFGIDLIGFLAVLQGQGCIGVPDFLSQLVECQIECVVLPALLCIVCSGAQAVIALLDAVCHDVVLPHVELAAGKEGVLGVAAVVAVGNAEQGVACDIYSALVLGHGIYQGIAGKRLAGKVAAVDALQQMERAVGLFLYEQLSLTDNPARVPATGCKHQTCQKKPDSVSHNVSPSHSRLFADFPAALDVDTLDGFTIRPFTI